MTCDICDDTKVVTIDYNDQADALGHGQYETPCECTLEDNE